MSLAALNWAFDLTLPPNEKIVLLVLANCENDETLRCDPKQPYIAEKASVSVRTVRDMLAALEDRDLIRREKRGNASGGGRASDNYRLAFRGFPADAAGKVSGKSEGGFRQAAAAIRNRKEPEVNTGPVPQVTTDGPVDNFGTGPAITPRTLSATHGKPFDPAIVRREITIAWPDTFTDENIEQLGREILQKAPARVLDPTGYVITALRNPEDKLEWFRRVYEIDVEAHSATTGMVSGF